MAVRNRRWNQALFPIDDHLLERLIEDHHALADDEADDGPEADDPFETAEGDADPLWYLVESPADEQTDEDLPKSDSLDAGGTEDAHAVNMRVLNDYLRRRLIAEPEPIAPTLH